MTDLPFDPNVMDRERAYILFQQDLPFKQIARQVLLQQHNNE